MKIVSVASIEGFYYKPRIDREYLKEHSEGIIALSACLGGEVQKAILNGNIDKAREAAIFYRDTFKDGFYLELQNHGIEEQKKVNEVNIQLAKELNIPLVATNDVHYINQEDSKALPLLEAGTLEALKHGIHNQNYILLQSLMYFLKLLECNQTYPTFPLVILNRIGQRGIFFYLDHPQFFQFVCT